MQQTSPVWKWLWNEGGKNLPPSEYEGDIAAFDNPGYTYPKDITIGIEPVQSGSGDPSPTNVRPISGWTGANVVVSNVAPNADKTITIEPIQQGTGDPSPTNVRPILPGLTFQRDDETTLVVYGGTLDVTTGLLTVTMAEVDLGTLNYGLRNHATLGQYFWADVSGLGIKRAGEYTSTIYPSICSALKCVSRSASVFVNGTYCFDGDAVNVTQVQFKDSAYSDAASFKAAMSGVQLVYELATPQTYQLSPTDVTRALSVLNNAVYPISWQAEAGTVYGGTLDVTTGLLTVTMAEVDLGTLNWTYIMSGSVVAPYFSTNRSDIKFIGPPAVTRYPLLCSKYATGIRKAGEFNDKQIVADGTPTAIFQIQIKDSAYTDAATFKAAMTGVQLVYELATSQTYQLSPTDVALLMGDNNVWADTGETTVALESPGPMHLEARATIGGTAYADISAPVITRATMQDRLSVGNVVSASLALAVRGAVNIPRSAAVVVEVRLNDGQTASEWLPQGTFYISRRMRDPVTGLLALECYDALLKANAVWTPSAGAWPRTMAAVTAELAALLGVTLDSRTVIPTGAAYAMSEPAEGATIRDVLGVVAQAAGGNWVMTPAGLLRLVRVGESGGTVDVTGVVGGIDVGQAGTVTGVRSTVDGVVTLIGDDTGIVVDVSIAPMIAAEMAEDLIGQAYAPFHLSGAIYDPAAELGDGVRAGAGGEVISALCSEQAAYGPAFRGDIAAPDPGEVTDEYPYIGSAERTLALAKATAIEAVDRLDDALTQQEIFNRLTDNGAAQGLLLYNGQLYINASYINSGIVKAEYIDGENLHVKAANIDGTLVIGQLPSDVAVDSDIPTKVSELTNDSGFQNSTQVTTITNNTISTTNVTAQNLHVKAANIDGVLVIGQLPSSVAETSDIPTKVSELTNDSGFQNSTQVTTITNNTISTTNVTAQNLHVKAANIDGVLVIGQLPSSVAETSDIPTKVSELTNDSGFQNSTQVTTITNNTISTTNVTAQNLHVKAANIDGVLVIGQLPSSVAETSDIPTKVSQLSNDSGFQNSSQVTTITNNTISTTNVTAQNLHVKAANVEDTFTANKIVGGTMTLGGANNVNGILQVLNANSEAVVTMNQDGATINSGSIVSYSANKLYRSKVETGGIVLEGYIASQSEPIAKWRSLLQLRNTLGQTAEDSQSYLGSAGDVNLSAGDLHTVRITGGATTSPEGRSAIEVGNSGIKLAGAVSFTDPASARANLDVPSTTGSGASGTWNINIPFSGDATGFKNFSLNAIDIDDTRGNWEAGFSDRTNHGTFPAWGGWCHVAQYDCDHFLYQVANYVDAGSAKVYGLSVRSRWWGGPWGLWTDIFYTNGAVPVASGGTGATDAPGARANLGIATTVTTVTTTGITSHGNWISNLNPNNVVIDAAYCTAGGIAVTPYCNTGGAWSFHCIDVSTNAAHGTAFDLTIRYHNIY